MRDEVLLKSQRHLAAYPRQGTGICVPMGVSNGRGLIFCTLADFNEENLCFCFLLFFLGNDFTLAFFCVFDKVSSLV